MIKILSTDQALSLKGTIPELAILRSIQFQGEGYSPEEHGHIIVLEAGDDLCHIHEIGPEGLYDSDDLPYFEFVEVFSEAGEEVYEVVIAIDNEKTIAVIIPDEPWLDAKLRRQLQQATQGMTPAAL
jgi:hypothetical protein